MAKFVSGYFAGAVSTFFFATGVAAFAHGDYTVAVIAAIGGVGVIGCFATRDGVI